MPSKSDQKTCHSLSHKNAVIFRNLGWSWLDSFVIFTVDFLTPASLFKVTRKTEWQQE